MTADEFLRLVASQESVVLEREVSVPGPAAQALLTRPILLSDYLSHPDRKLERRTFRYGHLLEPGIAARDLDAWQERFHAYPLPKDLRLFLLRANGIQLWADLEARHAYYRLLPLEEWIDVAGAPFAHIFDDVPDAALVMSTADDAAGFAVVDTRKGQYLWCDPIAGPEVIGATVNELLTYWWNHCAIEPRRAGR